MQQSLRKLIPLLCFWAFIQTDVAAQVPGYPEGVREVTYTSSGDLSKQPALVWYPDSGEPVPLLVALHTWSNDYRQTGGEIQYARWCQQAGWAFVHPNFRGVNRTPAAMGSDLVVADIRSAVEYAQTQTTIDARRIYCVGVSGGGFASMLMAAREPELWAGVSAWCGISDINAWHAQCDGSPFERYARHIESVLGGRPDRSKKIRADAWHRSAINWLAKSERLPPLDLNHGIHDGRQGSVPFTHSLLAFNAAVSPKDALPAEAIDTFYQTQQAPPILAARNEWNGSSKPDGMYGKRAPVYRVTAGTTRVTVFEGGHEIIHEAALNWLAAQTKGKPVNWSPPRLNDFSVPPPDRSSGK